MKNNLATDRLYFEPFALFHAQFVQELLNSEGWIRFIGNRNINSIEAAEKYIQKIIDSPTIQYWVVRLKDSKEEIGVITFIKRDYLEHHDIGFAFLPQHSGTGYAYEAASAVLTMLQPSHPVIKATTLRDNVRSIALLEKLGLAFEKEIEVENEKLLLYSTQSKS